MVKAVAAATKAAVPSAPVPALLDSYYKARSESGNWIGQLTSGTVLTGGQFVPSQTVNYCNAVPDAMTFDANLLLSTVSK